MQNRTLILGAGVTGLAAAYASRYPVFEASEMPGGICCSYYRSPSGKERLPSPPEDGEAYRFEFGGGHWIFGGDTAVLRFIDRVSPLQRYHRSSAVYFPEDDIYVEYPIQNNLRGMPKEFACDALMEMSKHPGPFRTMKEWLKEHFGQTLCEKFFFPFHDFYTAGLYESIAPQDAYKSPIKLSQAIEGSFRDPPTVGYNITFAYPRDGLGTVARQIASKCDIKFGKRAVRIDTKEKVVFFEDGSAEKFDTLLSTVPLNQTLELAGLQTEAKTCPHTSVLVLNIGATKGPACPNHHWLYVPHSRSGFHRVGFYSNVEVSFLPRSARENASAVSVYVERAYPGGLKPSDAEVSQYGSAVVNELREWGFIDRAEVVDPTWIDVAYTWEWPDSKWKVEALRLLELSHIEMVGRYGRWIFQGIADSIRDGFIAGSSIAPRL